MSRDREYLRLGLRVLDEQLVDSSGRRIGRVEDLEFDAGPGQPAALVSLLCGATAWKRRLSPRLADLIPGDPRGLRRVPLTEVTKIENEIELASGEDELTRSSETEAAPLAISQLLGSMVLAGRGGKLGRVRDVLVSRRIEDGAPWELHGLLIGRRGILQRLGFQATIDDDMKAGNVPENMIGWSRVMEFDDDGCLRIRDV